MSKEKYTEILKNAFEHGTPFINYTEYYSYALIPQENNKWQEVSYDFEDQELLENHVISAKDAYFNFCEEIEKAMSKEMELFYLNKWREFKDQLSGTEDEKLKALITELTSNSETYGKNFPVVMKKAEIDEVIKKL